MSYVNKNIKLFFRKIISQAKRDVLKSPVLNVLNTSHHKSVLISYVSKAFRNGMDITHTNTRDVTTIAHIFKKLGYNVDVVDYDYEGFIEYSRYHVIFGFGEPLVRSFYSGIDIPVRIYYGTGMHLQTQNGNSLRRIEHVFRNKKNWALSSGRTVDKAWSAQTTLVSAMICLGNEFVRKTYAAFYQKEIYLLSPAYMKMMDYHEVLSVKDFAKAKTHFLWFGSSGFIHKGVDLLLEVFKQYPELTLHICGPIDDEHEFLKLYSKELKETPSIQLHGFVKIDSVEFKLLLQKCGFIIFPSCSEGGPLSVLNVIGNGGLVPILTDETAIDLGDYGIRIADTSIPAVEESVMLASQLTEAELKARSEKAARAVNENNSIENYIRQLKSHLEQILKNHGL